MLSDKVTRKTVIFGWGVVMLGIVTAGLMASPGFSEDSQDEEVVQPETPYHSLDYSGKQAELEQIVEKLKSVSGYSYDVDILLDANHRPSSFWLKHSVSECVGTRYTTKKAQITIGDYEGFIQTKEDAAFLLANAFGHLVNDHHCRMQTHRSDLRKLAAQARGREWANEAGVGVLSLGLVDLTRAKNDRITSDHFAKALDKEARKTAQDLFSRSGFDISRVSRTVKSVVEQGGEFESSHYWAGSQGAPESGIITHRPLGGRDNQR